MKTIKFKEWDCMIEKSSYPNKRMALSLVDSIDGFPIAKATVNIPKAELEDNEVLIKDYSENSGMLKCLVDNKIVEYTGKVVPAGWEVAHVCKLLI